ncbi:hypothetical protein ABI59_21380 [Acidobacteria bacterium Mor1]|nr:hypothetical protein ABI59_21380 [Acidobacteria bacterium Mor1]
MKKSFLPIVGLALLLAGLPASAQGALSEEIALDTYRDGSERLTVVLGSYPASRHELDAFIPIPVAIGLEDSPAITLSPENFVLVDPDGVEYPAAGFGEIRNQYRKAAYDRSLLRLRPLVTGPGFARKLRLPSNFYPARSDGMRFDDVELSRQTWIADVLYFPMPDGGLNGPLTLRVAGKGIASPVEVRFEVPRSQRRS